MKPNNKGLIVILFTVLIVGMCITLSIVSISQNQITGVEAAEMICHNLIEHDMIGGREDCVIAAYHHDYMHDMFPVNQVNRAYVDAGMEGFGLSLVEHTSRFVRYGLHRNWLGKPSQPWVDFFFDERGILVDISFLN